MLLSPQSSPPWELTVSVKIPRFSVFPSTSPSSWFLDSGASNHMTSVILKPYAGHEKITAAIGQNLTISGIGSLIYPCLIIHFLTFQMFILFPNCLPIYFLLATLLTMVTRFIFLLLVV